MYYTYTTPVSQTGAQFMAYLESASNLTLTSYDEDSLENTAYGDSTNYANRYPEVRGDLLGVLVSSGSLVPLQLASSTGVDIATTPNVYGVYVAPRVTVSGSGSALATAVAAVRLPVVSSGSNTTYSSSTAYSSGQVFAWSGATITVTGTGIGTSSTTISGCNTPDIAVWSGSNVQIWAACNMGATSAYTGITIINCSNAGSDCDSSIRYTIGSYYQWGRNDDVTAGTFISSGYNGSLTNCSTSNTNFYDTDLSYVDWYTPDKGVTATGLWVTANQ